MHTQPSGTNAADSFVTPRAPKRRWIKRLGILGILFFLVKGLLWLAIPAWLAMRGCGS